MKTFKHSKLKIPTLKFDNDVISEFGTMYIYKLTI